MVVIRLISFRIALLTVNICECVRACVRSYVCTYDTDIKRTNRRNSVFFRIPSDGTAISLLSGHLPHIYFTLYTNTHVCIVWTVNLLVFFSCSGSASFSILNHSLAHCNWQLFSATRQPTTATTTRFHFYRNEKCKHTH